VIETVNPLAVAVEAPKVGVRAAAEETLTVMVVVAEL
jgi:hypothetical protein